MAYSSSSTAKGLGTSISVGKPAGTVDGDIVVVGFNYGVLADPVTPPSGWTSVYNSGDLGGSRGLRVYAKVADGEGASWAWGLNTSTNWVVHAVTLSGRTGSATPDANGGQTNASSTSVTAPSISPAATNCDLVGFFASTNGSLFTPPSGMTERQDDSQASAHNLEAATEALTSSGATGTRVATQGTAGQNAGWIGAFAPAPPGSGALYFGTT